MEDLVHPSSRVAEVLEGGKAPDLATLWRDDQKGRFTVVVTVSATVRETIVATSEAEARSKAEGMIENDGLDLMPDDVDKARIDSVRPDPTMYAVWRDGQEMGVSRPRPGDLPRVPTSEYDLARYSPPASA